MARAEFHRLTVAGVRRLTSEAVAVAFCVPQSLAENYRYVPGQYVTLRAQIDGEDIRRSYSICSAQGDQLEVGIKHLVGGKFSSFAQTLTAGDELDVMTPQGNFTALPGEQHEYLLIAAGSGITPCLSIAKTVLEQEANSRITLVYGNRSTATIMFRQDIGDLKDTYTDRLMVINVLSREKQEAAWLNGRITTQTIEHLIQKGLVDLTRCDAAYVCGPFELVGQVQEVLNGQVDVKTELFTTDALQAASRPPATLTENSGTVPVALTLDGSEHTIEVDPEVETVLAAAQKAGLDLPFSCAGGMCCTCRCKVVAGRTSMDMNFSLADWEVDAGFTLACQTRPLDDAVVLDFDEF